METRPVPTGRLIEPARAFPVPVFSAMGRISFDVGSLASEFAQGFTYLHAAAVPAVITYLPPEILTLPLLRGVIRSTSSSPLLS
jgi:hypothetical protein